MSGRLTECKNCGKTVGLNATNCPHCGSCRPAERVGCDFFFSLIIQMSSFIIAVTVIILVILFIVGKCSQPSRSW